MQKEIYKENYFGTLMCILVDESRRMMPTFNPTSELHKIQNDMCKAGSWIDSMPIGTIIETVPQSSVQKLQADALPEYRRRAANLIDQFISHIMGLSWDALGTIRKKRRRTSTRPGTLFAIKVLIGANSSPDQYRNTSLV